MKTYDKFSTIASRHNLTMVETTSDATGYPRSLQYALIGLEDFEQARAIAREHNMDIICLNKIDGQQLWHRGNSMYEAIRPTTADYGDDYNMYDGAMTEEEFYENEVLPMLGNQETMQDLIEFAEICKEVSEEISVADETQWVITLNGRYYDTIDKEVMEWSHDTHTYIIGLVDNE